MIGSVIMRSIVGRELEADGLESELRRRAGMVLS